MVIVTTKAERFVRALLAAQNPGLAAIEVIGREPGAPVPKPVMLRRLADNYGVGVDAARGCGLSRTCWRRSRRRPPGPSSPALRLFLADWGYNTPEDRASVSGAHRITLLSLERFAGPLDAWD